MGLFAPIRNYIETLIHPSAQQDVLTAARHRAFIAPRLLGSIVALAAFPVYLLIRGAPSAIELIAFAWLIAPILIAYFLSRTGRYESAHILSSLALTALVTLVAATTGGIASFAAIWARLLVKRFVADPGKPWRGLDWVDPLRKNWADEVDALSLPWYAEQKRDLGAFATFLGVVFQLGTADTGGTGENDSRPCRSIRLEF